MKKEKFELSYRNCTIVSEPDEDYLTVTARDLNGQKICEEIFHRDTHLRTVQVVCDFKLYIDNYMGRFECSELTK